MLELADSDATRPLSVKKFVSSSEKVHGDMSGHVDRSEVLQTRPDMPRAQELPESYGEVQRRYREYDV
jgi:hypothetical protein